MATIKSSPDLNLTDNRWSIVKMKSNEDRKADKWEAI